MRRLLSVLGLFWCGLVCASLPPDSLARLDYIGRVIRAADGSGKALTLGYNNQGQPTVVSNALGRLERIVYDAADQLIQTTDANNVTVTNRLDLLNRPTARFWQDGSGRRSA